MAEKKRLIDAKKLPYSIAVDDNGKQIFYVKAKDIDNAPTVDAVEVVRCKDCRFWEECDSSLIGKVMCCTGQGDVLIHKTAEDYCSCGERKVVSSQYGVGMTEQEAI